MSSRVTTKQAKKATSKAVVKRSAMNVAVELAAEYGETVRKRPAGAKRVLVAYAKAVDASVKAKRPVRYVVTVSPKGTPTISEESVATSAPSSASAPVEQDRAIAEALERGASAARRILADEEMLTADELADLLGTNRATINNWRRTHRLLGLKGPLRGYKYPRWQLDPNGVPFEVIPLLFEILGDHPWAVYRFLVQHHPELGKLTARQALQAGRTKDVLNVAESVARGVPG